jgi:hypothetical protein
VVLNLQSLVGLVGVLLRNIADSVVTCKFAYFLDESWALHATEQPGTWHAQSQEHTDRRSLRFYGL